MTSLKDYLFKQKFIYLFLLPGLGMIGYAMVNPLVPIFARRLGASGFEVGLITSGFMIARGVASFSTGRLIDWSGKRKGFIIVGITVSAIMIGLLFFVKSYVEIVLIRFMMGLCSGIVWPSAQVLVAENSTKNFRTRALSIYQASGKTGMFISRALLSLILFITANAGLAELESYRVVFLIGMAAMFIVALETLFIPHGRQKPKTEKAPGKPPYAVFLLSFVFGALIAQNPIAYVFFNEIYDIDPGKIALILLGIDILGIISIFVASHYTDKLGFHLTVWFIIIPTFIIACLIVLTKSFISFLLLYVLIRMLLSAFVPMSRSYASSINPNTGANLGTLNMMSNFGAVTGPLLGGLLFDKFEGGMKLSGYLFLSLLLLPSILFYLIMCRDKRKSNL